MAETESMAGEERFGRAMDGARDYLVVAPKIQSVWPVLAAAAFFAVSSMLFATAAILAPSVTLTHIEPAREIGPPPLAGSIN